MNLVSIIRSIEELLVEVMFWFILIPKTLAKLISSPGWPSQYVAGELSRPADERFDDYVSPVIFWLVLAVVPYFWALTPFVRLVPADVKQQMFLVALFLAVGPLGFATALLASQGKSVTGTALKPLFYGQCYCFTPAFLFCLPFVFLLAKGDGIDRYQGVALGSIGASILWLFVAEIATLHRTLQVSWVRAGLLFVPFLFASYMVAWASASVVLVVLTAVYALPGG